MTREESIDRLRKISEKTPIRTNGDDLVAITMAIRALSQEPCVYDLKNRYCPRLNEHGMLTYQKPCIDVSDNDLWIKTKDATRVLRDMPRVQPKPTECDDAISREGAEQMFRNARMHLKPEMYKSAEEYNTRDLMLLNAEQMIHALPPVTQKSGKWDRLYNWLNDMRLGIAPDETVTDIDERHCRESQTDLLDEIMEWMIKAESEDKE